MDWQRDPNEAYAQWFNGRTIAGRPYSEQTRRQYRSMFGAFARWMAAEGASLGDVDAQSLRRFVDGLRGREGEPATMRTRRIYLLEIERVLEHVRAEGLRGDNPARDLIREMKSQSPLKARNSALAGTQVRQRYLQILDRIDPRSLSLEGVRAHAMALLMLEQGFTLKEVQKLTLAQTSDVEQGWITAPGHRLMRQRRLPLSTSARHWLGAWLAVRASLRVLPLAARGRAGRRAEIDPRQAQEVLEPTQARVFVALRSPRGEPSGSARSAVNRISDWNIREAAVEAILMAQPDWPRHIVRGPQMLRNLCFLRLVHECRDEQEIAAWLGLQDVLQVRWMQRLAGVEVAPSGPLLPELAVAADR